MNSQTHKFSYGIDPASPDGDYPAVTIRMPSGYVVGFTGRDAEAILALISEREREARVDELMWALSRLNTFGKETDSDALTRAVDELDDNIGLLRSELKSQERESE